MVLNFDIIKAIETRKSIRTYNISKPLSEASLSQIRNYASTLSNPYGIHDIGIGVISANLGENSKLGTYGMIKGASSFCALYIKNLSIDTYLAAAYQFESLVLWLTANGLGTVWLGGTFRKSEFEQAFHIPDGYSILAVSPVGYGAGQRFTERMMRKFSSADSRKPWEVLFFNNDFNTPLLKSEAAEYETPLEMVRLAPSSLNGQPWRVLRKGSDFHFFMKSKKGRSLDEDGMKLLDMGISMCHFYATCCHNGINGQWSESRTIDISVPEDLYYIKTWTSR